MPIDSSDLAGDGEMKITRPQLRRIILEALEGPADIIDADTGEFYGENMFEADFALWLAANPEFEIADAGWAGAPEEDVFWVTRGTHEPMGLDAMGRGYLQLPDKDF